MNDVEKRLSMLISNLLCNMPGPTGNELHIMLMEDEYNLFVNRFETYKEGEYYIVGGNKWKITKHKFSKYI